MSTGWHGEARRNEELKDQGFVKEYCDLLRTELIDTNDSERLSVRGFQSGRENQSEVNSEDNLEREEVDRNDSPILQSEKEQRELGVEQVALDDKRGDVLVIGEQFTE